MRKSLVFLYVTITIISFCFVLSPLAQEKKEGEEIYTIKQGDTLWDISAKFLKDPFLWPKLWQRNPYVTNPHWIYPGQPIRLVSPEELMKEAPKEAGKEPEIKKAEPAPVEKKPEVVEGKPAEVKPGEAKRGEETPTVFPEARTAGFVSDVNLRGIGMVVENKDGKVLLAEGDIIYLAFRTFDPVLVGNKYTTIRPARLVKHPSTGKIIGRKYLVTGNIQIIDQQGNFYTAKVIEAFDYVSNGDLVRPYMKDK